MKRIENFKPQKGTLCISSALRDISKCMLNIDYGEEMYYGLGSGLFFGYIEAEDMVGLGAFTDLMLDNLKDNLSLTRFDMKISDDEAFDRIKFCIDFGLPAMVKGMHFNSREDLDEDLQLKETFALPMNLHYTLISGYDEETKKLFMSDNRGFGEVSFDRFLEVRDKEKYLTLLLFPDSYEHMSERIYTSVRKNVDYWYKMPERPKAVADFYTTNYLHLKKVYNTMEGMKKFKSSFLRGPEMESYDNFKKTMFFLRMVSYRGTGGDMTRGIQSRFLKECYKITGDEKMLEASKLYATCAREWRKLFKVYDIDPAITFEKVNSLVDKNDYLAKNDKMYDCEMRALEALRRVAYE